MPGLPNKFAQKSLCGLLCALFACGLSITVQAQANNATSDKSHKEVWDLTDQLDDLDRLSVITPLKFTPDQIDKIITVLEREQSAYDKKLSTTRAAMILKLGDEIRATRKQAIDGKTTPPAFFDKVKKARAEYMAFENKAGLELLGIVTKQMQPILTKEQIAIAAKLSKDAAASQKLSDKGTDEQWFNYYLFNAVITNNRMVPLLKELRANAKSAAVTAPNTTTGK